MFAFEADDELAGLDIPDADALVEGASGDVKIVGRDGDGGDSVLNGEVADLHVRFKIPETDASIAAAGCDDLAVAGEVQRVDVLLVAGELMLDRTAGDVPDLVHVSVAAIVVFSCSKHTLITLSSAPVARYCPLGLKQTLLIYRSPSSGRLPSCRCATGLPVSTSKI
jgi:hypothetical protein